MHRLRLVQTFALVLLIAAGPAHAIPIPLNVVPAAQTVDLGDTVTIDINVDPLGEIISVFDMIVNWDPALLSLNSVFFGSGLGGPLDSFQDVFSGIGNVNLAEVSLLFDFTGLQDGTEFTLFSLVFDTLDLGTSALTLQGNILFEDEPFNYIGDYFGFALEAAPGSGSITIVEPPVAIPEPNTLLLLLTALLAMGVIHRPTRRQFADGTPRI